MNKKSAHDRGQGEEILRAEPLALAHSAIAICNESEGQLTHVIHHYT